jgi:hypothetical protein
MGLRCFLTKFRSDPFEPDPVNTGGGKGIDAFGICCDSADKTWIKI